ncbi:sigma-54-dependent Fis family transcriptional regulator [Pengzhenrongella sp.]|jgi:transcriptional regulator of acetoin/glycerol metabolism|uniref:sigma-54-dependent Fis family transcriptional regulator n=1 Tax=Pengzhenrongella sp. TaxID=2888820 RepID=UPI002F93B5B1
MSQVTQRRSLIAEARTDFLSHRSPRTEAVTDVVAASWRRSRSAGVDVAMSRAQFHDDIDVVGRLVRCSEPVIARLRDETADLSLSIVLTDHRATILSRTDTDKAIGTKFDRILLAPGFGFAESSVGTNGIGTVFESGASLCIVGPEHFTEHLQPFDCAGSPIRAPFSGRVEGVLDISCLSEHSNPLLHALVRSAARDIEHNLLLDRSQRQQALFEAFVRLDARRRGAVLAIGAPAVMSNAAAQQLFDPAEQRTLQDHARYLMTDRGKPADTIELASGKVVQLRGTRVVVGNDVVGIVVAVDILSEAVSGQGAAAPVPAHHAPDRAPASPTRAMTALATDHDGSSPLWRRACAGIVDAVTSSRPLLVMGETGAGKLTLIGDLFRRVAPDGKIVVVTSQDKGRLSYRDLQDGLGEVSVRTLFVFTNIDQLGADARDGLTELLRAAAASDRPVSVAATLLAGQLDLDCDFGDLLACFQTVVTVPPLRHRMEDLPGLVAGLLAHLAGRQGVTLSASALRVVAGYSWPRNIRQLSEALVSALRKRPVGEIQNEDLPGYCYGGAQRRLSVLESVERDLIVAALHDTDGNRVQAAAALGIARSSLYRKLKSFRITTA